MPGDEQECVPLSSTEAMTYTRGGAPPQGQVMYTARVFWDAIEWFRQERGITKTALAKAIEVDPTTLNPKYRASHGTKSLETVFKAMKFLKIQPKEYVTMVEMLAQEKK